MFLLGIFGFIISLLLLYLVIEAAIKNGINRSVIGEYLIKKHEEEEKKKLD